MEGIIDSPPIAPAGDGAWTQFVSQLPEDIRAEPSLQTFKDSASFVRSAIETKKLVGDAAVLRPPKDDAQRPEWLKATRAKAAELGVLELPPEAPDKYEFKFDGATPEAIKADPLLNEYRALAHSAGLSNSQAQTLLAEFGQKILPGLLPKPVEFIEKEGAQKLFNDTFKTEAPATLENYQYSINVLKSQYPELQDLLQNSYGFIGDKAISFWDHPTIIKLFSDKGAGFRQDFAGDKGGGFAGETLESVDAKIAAIMRPADRNDPKHKAYMDNDGAVHAELKKLFETKAKIIGAQPQ